MIRIAVCEDEVFLGGEMEKLLYKLAEKQGISIQTEVFTSAEQCYAYLQNESMVDILYLDIELGVMSGIELASIIRNEFNNDEMQIIYVSSKKSYAMELFESHPLNFIVKPLEEEKFAKIFYKAAQLVDQSEKTFSYKKGRSYHKMFFSEILYFEASNREVILHGYDRCEKFYGSLKNIYSDVSQYGFFFCHKSFLVQYDKVRTFESNRLIMQNGDEIPISQGQRRAVKEIQLQKELRLL